MRVECSRRKVRLRSANKAMTLTFQWSVDTRDKANWWDILASAADRGRSYLRQSLDVALIQKKPCPLFIAENRMRQGFQAKHRVRSCESLLPSQWGARHTSTALAQTPVLSCLSLRAWADKPGTLQQ